MDAGRDLDVLHVSGRTVCSPIPDEDARLDEASDAFLQKERVAAGAGDQQRRQFRGGGLSPEQVIEQQAGDIGRERLEQNLRVVAFVAPPVPVLGTVTGQNQQPMLGDALHQGVQDLLRLRVDPVQILDDDDDGLQAALLHEQAREGLQRPAVFLVRVERAPRRVDHWHIEECQERGGRRHQRGSERQQPGDHPLADLANVVAGLNEEIRLQQVDDRQVRGLRPVRGGAGHKHPAVAATQRLAELPEKTRLADAGLTGHADHLPVPLAGMLERVFKLPEFVGARHERREMLAEPGAAPADPVEPIRAAAVPAIEGDRRQREASLQKHPSRLADEDRSGPDVGHARAQRRPCLALGVGIDPAHPIDPGDQHVPCVQPDPDARNWLGPVVLHGEGLDRQRSVGGASGRILHRLEAEDRH